MTSDTPALPGSTFELSRWLFQRALAGVFLIAFVSLWVQIDGLIGSAGILPVAEYLDRAGDRQGARAWYRVPTILWLNSSDWMLHAVCAAGVLLSVLLLVGVAPRLALAGLWLA